MTRTLVTGASGFTGRCLVELLSEQGDEVHGLVHDAGAVGAGSPFVPHVAELADAAGVLRIIEQVQPDRVVHLAAIAFVAHGDVAEMYRTNVVGTRHLLEALSSARRRPSAVLIASSANVYGNAGQGLIDETVEPAPANDYAVSKLAMEYVAGLYRNKLPLTVVRPFNYTGRGQSANFLIPKIVDHARKRAPVLELGNLDVARDFSDVRTVADAYDRLLGSAEAVGRTFNVASGQATSLRDVVEIVSRISGHQFDVRVNPAFVRADEVRTLAGSKAAIEGLLGPLDSVPLEDTIRWMLED